MPRNPDNSAADQLAVPVELIERRIYLIRGHKVMLDSDLAELYQVETFNLNKAVKRNLERFPDDFMFQLTKDEAEALRFQIGMSKPGGGGRPVILTVRLHRARRCHALVCPQQRSRRADEHPPR